MGIFSNNITPSVPEGISWNNTCYDIFIRELYKKLYSNTYWDWETGCRVEVDDYSHPPITKLDIKRKFQNMKRLPKLWEEALQNTVEKVYSKYGVWAKWKVQMGANRRIKSIYFVKFC